jgi:hypothetical protein
MTVFCHSLDQSRLDFLALPYLFGGNTMANLAEICGTVCDTRGLEQRGVHVFKN